MSARFFLLSIVAAQSLYAMNVDKHNYFTRDYLDFGQNLGQFSANSKNIAIIKKDGEKVALPNLPFPDFLKFDGSNRTSVGGAYTASSKHVVAPNQNRFVLKNFKLGETTYTDIKVNPYLNDSAFTRVNKFIVEGGYRITNFQDIKKNPQDYLSIYDGEERIILYRSGSGLMSFGDWRGSPQASDSVKSPGIAGNFFYLKLNEINDPNKLVVNDNNYGPLRGSINTGDSGSPALVFNNKLKEWELIGTAWGATKANGNKVANTFFSIAIPSKLEEFKKQFEVRKETNDIDKFEKDKDNVYSESGIISINEEVVNAGGIILRGEQKTLNINGNSRFAGAGVDIANKNSKIVWNVSTKDDLHKIGKGTLEVVKATDGKLRMGEGITRLKAKNSFKEVHLAHREGVLIIDAENATDYNKFSFGKNGGTLDLNGYSVVMEGIRAFNANAIISNNAEKISTLTLNNKKNVIVHATFGGNIKIQAGAINETNVGNRNIIFDGGFDLKSLFGDNQHIVLQGKPVPHATWKDGYLSLPPVPPFWGAKEYFIGHYIDKFDKEKANSMGLGHMVVNQTVTFTQPDWIQREYKGTVALSGNSKLFIERNVDMMGDITLNDNSQLTFNSKTLYIDTKDSKELEQDIQSQPINANVKDTITFRGKLTANNQSKIVSNGIKELSASIDLSGNSSLDAKWDEIKILKEGLRLKDNSSFTAKTLYIKNKSQSSIFVDENSQLNIDELKLEKSEAMFNIRNENLNFKLSLNESILNVADGSKIPQSMNLKKSTLAFENIGSTLSLKNATFDDASILKIKNLTHKQNDNNKIAWRNNGVKRIDLSDVLKLENVGSGSGDEKFLALKLDDVEMSFADTSRVVVSFVKNYLDNDTTLGRLYDVVMLKKLTSQGDLLVHFEGQDNNSKIQAFATKTNTGIKISFTQDNQVSAEHIMSAIDNRAKHHQFFLLSDFIATHTNHPLVLDVAFNKNNNRAIDRIIERIEKIDSDAKTISKTTAQGTNLQIINHYNKITSKRISALQNNISANNEISSYLYASLASDVPLLVYPMFENPHNGMWVNTGGGYFDSNGHLKYFSTTIGYDKQFVFGERDAILGLLMSFGKSYASNSAYNDNTSNYGFGLYGALTHDAHELQFSKQYIIGKSKKYNKLSMDKMTDYSFGISGVYKHAFEFDASKTYKPIFGLEYVINKMAEYALDIMRVGAYDYRALNGILGVECGYTKENLFLSAGISGKKAIARTNDKMRVGIDGSNRFVGYDLQSDSLIYNLDLTTNYKINDALLLETNVNVQTTLKGDNGVSGLLKGEYRF